MKYLLLLGAAVVAISATAITRSKRQASYELPDGAHLIFPGTIKSTFQCPQSGYGYFADVDNACYIFHVCHTVNHPDGSAQTLQYSFICGNQTIFDQLTLSCTYPEDAIPCGSSTDFLYLNARIGQEKEFFHTDQDIERGNQLKTGGSAPRPGGAGPRPGGAGGRG